MLHIYKCHGWPLSFCCTSAEIYDFDSSKWLCKFLSMSESRLRCHSALNMLCKQWTTVASDLWPKDYTTRDKGMNNFRYHVIWLNLDIVRMNTDDETESNWYFNLCSAWKKEKACSWKQSAQSKPNQENLLKKHTNIPIFGLCSTYHALLIDANPNKEIIVHKFLEPHNRKLSKHGNTPWFWLRFANILRRQASSLVERSRCTQNTQVCARYE